MFANSKTEVRRLRWPLLSFALLSATACGGKEDGRPVGDSTKSVVGAATDCDAQTNLAQVSLLQNGDFSREAATGWGSTTDKSPNPATAPKAILKCPQDSTYDCCLFQQGEEPLREVDVAAQADYHCAEATAPTTATFGGSIGTQPIPAEWPVKCDGAAPSGRALHVRAARFTDWGAQVYFTFSPAKDASAFDGISFWARLGKGGTQPVGQTLFVVVEDTYTKENQPKFELAIDPETGGIAMEKTPAGDFRPKLALDASGNKIPVYTAYNDLTQAANCYDVNVDTMKCDRFGSGVGLESEWRFVKIPFSGMRQRGYGVKSPAGRPLREELLGFGIYMDVGNWDFWIDQVAFYKDVEKSTDSADAGTD